MTIHLHIKFEIYVKNKKLVNFYFSIVNVLSWIQHFCFPWLRSGFFRVDTLFGNLFKINYTFLTNYLNKIKRNLYTSQCPVIFIVAIMVWLTHTQFQWQLNCQQYHPSPLQRKPQSTEHRSDDRNRRKF